MRGRSKEKCKKREKGKFVSCERPKSLGKSKEKCWNYEKVRHFKRDYNEDKKKNKKENNDFDDESKNSSKENCGDAFVATLAT